MTRGNAGENSIRLIRNATMRIAYAGRTFLTDPMLSEKGMIESFAGIARNPTVALPCPIGEIVDDVDGVIVSHLHSDHFDDAAMKAIPKGIPLFCQPGDKVKIGQAGFQNIMTIESSCEWQGITITRVEGQHGRGAILPHMGKVSGFVLQAAGEPTVYLVGDSILYDQVRKVIEKFKPDVIITHSGGATIPGYDPIIMNIEDTLAVIKASGRAKVVAVHMEALDHCTVTRQALMLSAGKESIPASRLVIPADGEVVGF